MYIIHIIIIIMSFVKQFLNYFSRFMLNDLGNRYNQEGLTLSRKTVAFSVKNNKNGIKINRLFLSNCFT